MFSLVLYVTLDLLINVSYSRLHASSLISGISCQWVSR